MSAGQQVVGDDLGRRLHGLEPHPRDFVFSPWLPALVQLKDQPIGLVEGVRKGYDGLNNQCQRQKNSAWPYLPPFSVESDWRYCRGGTSGPGKPARAFKTSSSNSDSVWNRNHWTTFSLSVGCSWIAIP
jgi:hypothetical protein